MKTTAMPFVLATAIATVGLPSLPVAAAPAQAPLASQSKLTRPDAERIALAKVPSGVVQSAELEHEHGALVWSFDIAKPGSKGIHEIQVDANSGAIVANEIETPRVQAQERDADQREQAASARQH